MTSNSCKEVTGSASDNTSTVQIISFNSSSVTWGNLGSQSPALIAFSITSSAIFFCTPWIVPMHPRNLPSLSKETNAPAFNSNNSLGILSGTEIFVPSLTLASNEALANAT